MAGKWITPFKKQCFVVLGASINMSQIGFMLGYATVLLPQLQVPGSTPIDETLASWIASLPGLSLLLGNLTVPILMGKLGRWKANLISIVMMFSTWVCLFVAQDINWILIARFFQGLSGGMITCLIPIIIGECTSPKNRGAFLVLMSVIMAAGTLTIHTLGSYVTWKTTALIVAIISLVDLLIVALSPETPSWLADQGRYEECEKVFLWLRSEEEIDELNRLIETSIITRQSSLQSSNSISSKLKEYILTVKKKEFYKPIIIMIHLYALGQWGGINILTAYVKDMVRFTVTSEVDIALVVITVDVQRVISTVFAVYIIRKFKRRTILFVTCGINTLVFLITAGYVYAKTKTEISFDHPIIGILLIHILMATIAIGSLTLPYTIAGEIFALRYKSLSSGISILFCSINIFLPVKTFPFLINSIGLHGAYCLYSVIMIYCLAVVWFTLPETKDRTLQDIEDEFKGKLVDKDLKASQPLTVFKSTDDDE